MQELQGGGTSDADVDEEPQSFFIRDEESCCGEEPPWILWAWTPFEPRVGCYGYWVWTPWEWREETGECDAYD